jgi:hypothetical protein
MRQKVIDGYLPHEREARANGVPLFGGGQVFPYTEASISCDPFIVPRYWRYIWGIDPGVGHPFGAALLAHNVETDTIYVVHTIRMKDALPLQHAAAMKSALSGFGGSVPVAWPQDAHQRREFDGQLLPLASIYRKHGLKMLDHHSTFIDGSNSTELGILEMQERMTSNRFKVFGTLKDWFEELRRYHRDEKTNEIVKVEDDLMSATRVGAMSLRKARAVLWAPNTPAGTNETGIAKDVDIDPWG